MERRRHDFGCILQSLATVWEWFGRSRGGRNPAVRDKVVASGREGEMGKKCSGFTSVLRRWDLAGEMFSDTQVSGNWVYITVIPSLILSPVYSAWCMCSLNKIILGPAMLEALGCSSEQTKRCPSCGDFF
jgi:hypothetical protein